MFYTQSIENHNGLILKTNYIPEELLIQILSYVDHKQLVSCHLVCKKWNKLIKENVWRIKAERTCGKSLVIDNGIPWTSYYSICYKEPFKRNLLTSNNVQVFYEDEDNFKAIQVDLKDPSINALPTNEDLLFKENINCIKITHDSSVRRKFVVNLVQEGLTDFVLDNLQPDIKISEWYCTIPEEEKAEYECSIKLLNSNDIEDCVNRVMRVYHFDRKLNNADKRGKWFKFTHVLKNYGPGLRVVKFYDGGHNNIILAGASMVISVPSKKNVFKNK